jgi:protein-tyrosine phosphatase
MAQLPEMAVNLRELGGIATADGRRIRRGIIYRSGDLSDLTEACRNRMAELGIVARIDFRSTAERKLRPYNWHAPGAIQVWENPSNRHDAAVRDLIEESEKGTDAAHAAMHAIYRELPIFLSSSYAVLFRWLSDGRLPILYSCTAGKDRTGVATALILWALGVEKETITEEYELSNGHLDQIKTIAMRLYDFNDDASVQTILASDRLYIEQMMNHVEYRFKSIEGYLTRVLNFDADSLKRMRDQTLE